MDYESIFGEKELPRAVDFRQVSKLEIDPIETIPFEPVEDETDTSSPDQNDPEPHKPDSPKKPDQPQKTEKPDELKEIEELAGIEIDDAFGEDGSSIFSDGFTDDGELGENGSGDSMDDDPWNFSLAELISARDIVEFVEEYRTKGHLMVYEWRAGIKRIRAYYRHLSSKQNRSGKEQKQWEELDKFIARFGEEYKALEDKITWSDKYRDGLVRFAERILEHYGYNKIPFWVAAIFIELKAGYRCGTKDTMTDELTFHIPEDY